MSEPNPKTPEEQPHPRSVVSGMDFSRTAMAALELAVLSAHGGTVHVVSAYEVPLPPFPDGQLMLAQAAEIELATRKELDGLVNDYRSRGVAMDARVVIGSAVSAILETARETHAELVVVGTHGRTGLARLALGSIAERVVRLSPVPVLTSPLVREREPTAASPAAVILIATDFSRNADAAIRAGLALSPRASTIHLVHVFEGSLFRAQDDFADSARHIRELALEREVLRYESAGTRITHRVRSGVADEEILREAMDVGADRIVVGTAGRTGLDRLLLGSVAESVVRGSRVPVLVARATHEA